jgi:hypothetical protein
MHGDMINDLTEKLYAEGWTRENHPDYVYWSDFENFGYKWETVKTFVWETECGLMADVYDVDVGDCSFDGVLYCAENDNPLTRCPYGNKMCEHIPAGFPFPHCPCRRTDKPFNYENSVKRINDEQAKREHKQWMEITGGTYCACVVGSNGYAGGNVQVHYDVENCIHYGCKNETCVIRKQPRDLSLVNIFYDVRRTWITKKGLIDDTRTEVTKGCKVFPKAIARTDAEIWLKVKQAEYNPLKSKSVVRPHLTPTDRAQEFFSKHHRSWPDYDYFEFHYDVENIRIAKSEQRDLLQDLRDVEEGLEIIHASDQTRAAKALKRDKRQKSREQKDRAREKRAVSKLQAIVKTHEDEQMQEWAMRKLKRRGIDEVPEQVRFDV